MLKECDKLILAMCVILICYICFWIHIRLFIKACSLSRFLQNFVLSIFFKTPAQLIPIHPAIGEFDLSSKINMRPIHPTPGWVGINQKNKKKLQSSGNL